MAVGDVLQVRFAAQAQEQAALNIRQYLVTSETGAGATYQAIASHLRDLTEPGYRALMSVRATFLGVGVRRLHPTQSTEVVGPSAEAAGTVPGDTLPRQTCGIITLRTGVSGRNGRGRMYIPFPSEQDNDIFAVPTEGYVDRLNDLAEAVSQPQTITQGASGTTIAPVVYNRATLNTIVITFGVGRPRWATQRRRGSYGRANANPFA